jgi:hypothetical protein
MSIDGEAISDSAAALSENRRQRNRINFELAAPSDLEQTRLATTLAAGGRVLDESATVIEIGVTVAAH